MKKLLITGFDPFGGETINPSWEAVNLLPVEIGGYVLTKLRIPVVFGEAAETVIRKSEELRPDATPLWPAVEQVCTNSSQIRIIKKRRTLLKKGFSSFSFFASAKNDSITSAENF